MLAETLRLLLVVSLALPLAATLLCLIPGMNRRVFTWSAWTALPAMAVSVSGLIAQPSIHVAWPRLMFGVQFGIHPGNTHWLFFTSVLWFASAAFGRYYLAHDEQRGRYTFFFLGAMTGNFGLILAREPIVFFASFAMMSFMSYGLVVHDGRNESKRAGRVYLGMAILGEVFQFAGLSLALFPMIGNMATPGFQSLEPFTSGNGLITGLFIAGFGIKAGLLGLHVWLPMAHPVAPTPASAVLSGAMIKAGLIGWINFLPLGMMEVPWASHALIVLGLSGAMLAAVMGVTQNNPKAVLAYSSVSQMGLMITAIGVGLGAPAIWKTMIVAVTLYAAHHAFAKCLLFLGVGLKTSRPIAGWERAFFWGGMTFAALALIGAPLTGGALAKAVLKDAVSASGLPNARLMVSMLTAAAAGTTMLMIRFMITLRKLEFDKHHAAAPAIWWPWSLLLLGVLAGPVLVAVSSYSPLLFMAWKPDSWLKFLLPLGGGALLYMAGAASARKWKSEEPVIPAGDLFFMYAWLGDRVKHLVNRAKEQFPPYHSRFRDHGDLVIARISQLLASAESSVASWTIGAVVWVSLTVVLFWLVGFPS